MKLLKITLFVITTNFTTLVLAQDKLNLWTNELYRVGQILSYERYIDGAKVADYSNEPLSNVIYNIYIEEYGGYGRFDLSMITLLFFNQNKSQHWSYNLTVGAFVNDNPLQTGNINHHIGVGADFDISNVVVVNENSGETSFNHGSIGLNLRWDIEFGKRLILQNSITHGRWGSTKARKWDIRSMIGLEIINGLFLTAAPNFIMLSNEKRQGNTEVINRNISKHLYCTFGLAYSFNY